VLFAVDAVIPRMVQMFEFIFRRASWRYISAARGVRPDVGRDWRRKSPV
jgi:hypothetical protein